MYDLVTLDLDGTLLPHDTAFATVLRANGRQAEVEASDERYFAGDSTLDEVFWQQWAWVQELTLADCHRALRKAEWLPGIADGVKAFKASDARVCLLTDQPSTLTDFLGRWGLTDAICSPVEVKDGCPVSIDARFDKMANLEERLKAWRIEPRDVCHVGNGANDVPVWHSVGGSVAAFAQPDVAHEAKVDAGEPASLMELVAAVQALADRQG